MGMHGYELLASPTLYAGQKVMAGFTADRDATVRLFLSVYNERDELDLIYGTAESIAANDYIESEWIVPNTHGQPIAEIGFECSSESGCVYLDYLTWEGEPDVQLTRPSGAKKHQKPPLVWRKAWVNAIDIWEASWPEPYRLIQNSGRGLIVQGTREWKDYEIQADITPWLMDAGGIAVRVQGQKRFYALQLEKGNKVRLIKALDGDTVLAEKAFRWEIYQTYALKMRASGNRIRAWVDDELQFDVTDESPVLSSGGVAYVVDLGLISSNGMQVRS
jgi:hypothetical protein